MPSTQISNWTTQCGDRKIEKKMEMFIFRHSEWARIYNCTGIDIESIPFDQRHQFVPEAWALIILCTIYYILYIPCMISIWKHLNENVCFKLLFYIGITDLAILWILGYAHAVFSLNGNVFCSSPVFNFLMGASLCSLFVAESSADLVLAFNRCLELMSPNISRKLFSGFRIHIWLAFCTIYSLYILMFMLPVVFSSLIFAWPRDPFFGYRPDLDGQFVLPMHAFHDGAVIILSPIFYGVFAIVMCIKTRSFGLGQAIPGPQKKAFLQVFLISTMNVTACSIYVFMDYIIPPQWMITMAQFMWFHVHGFPPVIYLALNHRIRHDCRMMFYKVFLPNKIQKLHGVTVMVVPGPVSIPLAT